MVNIDSTRELYSQYKTSLKKIADIKYAASVLQWDQETYMPPGGAGTRAQQIATLTALAHATFTDEKIGRLLTDLSAKDGLSDDEKKNVELSLYDYNRQRKLPEAFVHTLSEATSKSFHIWVEARKENDFCVFLPALKRLVNLKKQEADLFGYEGHPYNALLNEYERGCTVALLDNTFDKLRRPLQHLLEKISNSPQVNNRFLHQYFPKDKQWEFGLELIRNLGFDLNAGRQDLAEHPFTTNFSSSDVRITTRIDAHDFANMTWSCIHEAGHALYEQGLPADEYGLPLGEYASLSMHESQSRLWENNVGRSPGFWKHHYSSLTQYFPAQFEHVSVEEFYAGINKVQSSLIRTEADEVTYHFHVMIRYELEKQLIEGSLAPADIPAYWNDKYRKYLGITVPDDKRGCLQDVHWSHGSFGYFPTYSLGSFYAAQFYHAAGKEAFMLEEDLARGNTMNLLKWLRTNIHLYGRKFNSEELCRRITGQPLDTDYFVSYIQRKYGDIYQFHV